MGLIPRAKIAWADDIVMESRGVLVQTQRDVGVEVIFVVPSTETADRHAAVDRISSVHIEFGYATDENVMREPYPTEALFYGLQSGDLQWMR